MPKKLTKEKFVEQLSIEHPNLELVGDYFGNKGYLTVRCKVHDYMFQTKPNWLHVGHGCKLCYHEKRANESRKTTKEFTEEAKKVHGNIYDYSKVDYQGNKTKVCIICPKHGEFWQRPDKHLSGKGCPLCNESHLERNVVQLLEENHIEYIRQKRFKWLGNQSLDFYLPQYNIAIECQGEQHYKSVPFFGGEDELFKVKERDEKKCSLVEDNGIKLCYIINDKIKKNTLPKLYTSANTFRLNEFNILKKHYLET